MSDRFYNKDLHKPARVSSRLNLMNYGSSQVTTYGSLQCFVANNGYKSKVTIYKAWIIKAKLGRGQYKESTDLYDIFFE